MSETNRRYKAVIDDKTYVIVGPKSTEHMETVSQLVNEQLDQLKALTRGLDAESRAILLALNTVSEQIELQQKISRLEEQLGQTENENS